MKIGFITCEATKLAHYFPTRAEPEFIPVEPPFTPDDQIAVDELRKYGCDIKPIVWGHPIDQLNEYDLIIIRSPWDYMDSHENKHQFMQWVRQLEQAGVPVVNPSHFMQWMLDKHYLKDMNEQGVHTIPTQYLAVGSQINLSNIFHQKGQFILKPRVSAAGVGLFPIQTEDDARQYQDEINARLTHSSYMLQDFVADIIEKGEWSLVFIGGQYSHAVHKKPGKNSIFVHAERGGSLSFSKPQHTVIEFAKNTYQKIFPAFEKAMGIPCDPSLILYLRIDVIETKSGPVLIECEGVEPELFFRAKPKSEEVFRKAIVSVLKKLH